MCSLIRMTRRSVVKFVCLGNRAVSLLCGNSLRPVHTSICVSSQQKAGFKPEKVAVVTKTTRYEFELQRYRYAGLSEEDFKQLVRVSFTFRHACDLQRKTSTLLLHVLSVLQLAMKGSSYSGLLERHNIHTNNVEHIVKSLR